VEIQFSEHEVNQIRQFFDQVNTGEIQAPFPAGNTVFLLLRKLLAYGVYYVPQIKQEISYQDLQRMSTKPRNMLTAVQMHFNIFDKLLVAYTTNQQGTR
jgi:hypothetical protein